MAVSCISSSDCYIPGGSNGVGFDVFRFNGKKNGVFTPLSMPSKMMMVMAIGMGGDQGIAQGCIGGMGIGNGVQYAVNASTFEASHVPTLMVVTQDIRATKDGKSVLVVDNAGSNAVLFSNDAGKTFVEKKITSAVPAGASARYAALVSDKTWFVTFGSWPSKNKNQQSARVEIVDGKRVTKSMMNLGNETNGYTAAIVKTTDGGETWTTVFSSATTFYFNAIDCVSETLCVAVGEGMNAGAGAHIYRTTDGSTFTQVLELPSGQNGMYSMMSLEFASTTQVWAAGSIEGGGSSSGLFYYSGDAGKTWQRNAKLANIGDVTDLSFTAGGIGFATAVTVFDDSTILRYDANGPAPGPSPAPGPGPAPTPTAAPGIFIQEHCTNAACTQGCQNSTLPTNKCLRVNGGGSAIVKCSATELVETVYRSTTDCTGASQSATMPLNQCLQGQNKQYFENLCPSSVSFSAANTGALHEVLKYTTLSEKH
eukprot:599_1